MWFEEEDEKGRGEGAKERGGERGRRWGGWGGLEKMRGGGGK